MGQSEQYLEARAILDEQDDPLPVLDWVFSRSATVEDKQDFASRFASIVKLTKSKRRVDRDIEKKTDAFDEYRSGARTEKRRVQICEKYGFSRGVADYAVFSTGDKRVVVRSKARREF